MSLLSTLRLDARAAGFLGLTLGMYSGLEIDTALGSLGNGPKAMQLWTERWGRSLLKVLGVEITARGPHLGEGRLYPGTAATGKGRIFVMNHRSSMDILVALASYEATIVSRADLARWPLIGAGARRVGTLFVDRASKQSGAAVIQAMEETLNQGRGVAIFPEGTSYVGDEVHHFHPGAFSAAVKAGAEVVPAGIAYESDTAAFGDESFGEHIGRIARAEVTKAALVVGEPLPPSTDREALRAQAHARVVELVAEARKTISG